MFISHASEDKERFVLNFARKLRSRGIDAWVDRWEMLPGDSLVTKIFEEGIKDAQAMIVVISEYSVNKRWVRAELNVGVVNQIEQASRLIPVIIGDVEDSEIPQSLRDTLWERVRDPNNYAAEFERIVRSIYGQREKPELGDPPAYVQMEIDRISDLDEVDSLILRLCCEASIEENMPRIVVDPGTMIEVAESFDIPREQTLESLDILESRRYINCMRTISGVIHSFRLTDYGFDEYAKTYLPNYDELSRMVALQIINHNKRTCDDIAKALHQPPVTVDHILRRLRNRQYIKAQEFHGGFVYVHGPTAELKRWLQQT